jgi:hypothetical protein
VASAPIQHDWRLFRLGYIRSPAADAFFFVSLPLLALAIAFGFHQWLPYAAGAAVALWVTVPHHYATWVRTYGLPESRERWPRRLFVVPLVLVGVVFFATAYLPLSIGLVILLWDHQHSVMQQHGFGRIYDLKAGTGAPSTRNLDRWLNIALYLNLLIVSPLWTEIWVKEIFNWNLAIGVDTVRAIHAASWSALCLVLLVYAGHVAWSLRQGYSINPIKYLFLAASYSLWYAASWQDSLLLQQVAHRIMHGVQYIAMVYWYLERNQSHASVSQRPSLLGRPTVLRFVLWGIGYALLFQLVSGMPLEEFGFGLGPFLREEGYLPPLETRDLELWAAALMSCAGVVHYYVDSFIWKIREPQTRRDL